MYDWQFSDRLRHSPYKLCTPPAAAHVAGAKNTVLYEFNSGSHNHKCLYTLTVPGSYLDGARRTPSGAITGFRAPTTRGPKVLE